MLGIEELRRIGISEPRIMSSEHAGIRTMEADHGVNFSAAGREPVEGCCDLRFVDAEDRAVDVQAYGMSLLAQLVDRIENARGEDAISLAVQLKQKRGRQVATAEQ